MEPQSQSGSLIRRFGPRTRAVANAGVANRWATPANVAKVRENHRGARRNQGDETPKSISIQLWSRFHTVVEQSCLMRSFRNTRRRDACPQAGSPLGLRPPARAGPGLGRLQTPGEEAPQGPPPGCRLRAARALHVSKAEGSCQFSKITKTKTHRFG